MSILLSQFVTFFFLGSMLLITICAIFIFFFVQFHKNRNSLLIVQQQLQSHHQQELLRTQLEIQEQTLTTISQEIHDNIGQALSLAKLNLNTLAAQANETDRKKVATALGQVGKAITDLRNLARSLHSDKIAELGLADAIGSQLTIIENSGQFTTRLSATGDLTSLTPPQQLVLFRMVQELLNNAVKHSHASEIAVTITAAAASTILTVADNGQGFDASQLNVAQTGIGLTNIYRRAAVISAKVCVLSSPGGGTTVSIEIQN